MATKDWKLIQTIGVVGCVAVIPLGFAIDNLAIATAIGVVSVSMYAIGRFAVWFVKD
ncbi:MAG: hypothetical protein ACKV2Q_13505 [Planctomycetaceae bacterium]